MLKIVNKIKESTLTPNDPQKHTRKIGDISCLVIHRNAVARDIVELAAFFKNDPIEGPSVGFRQPYHFFIQRDGTIEQGHSLLTIGAGAVGRNKSGIQICLDGDFRKKPAENKQLESLQELCTCLISVLGLDPYIDIQGHENTPRKVCPGLFLNMKQLQEDVASMLNNEQYFQFNLNGIY